MMSYIDQVVYPPVGDEETLIFYNPNLPSTNYKLELSGDLFIPGSNVVVSRENWDSDSTYLYIFMQGNWVGCDWDFYDCHTHSQAGSFDIYKNGMQISETPGYADGYNYEETYVHNNMLFWEEGQGSHPEGNVLLNGQEITEDYVYISGDLDGQYNSGGYDRRIILDLQDYDRSFFYLKPNRLLVYDKFEVSDPSHSRRWLMHYVAQPTVTGTQVGSGSSITYYDRYGTADNLNAPYTLYENVNQVYTTVNGVRSFAKLVYPTSGYQMYKIHGTDSTIPKTFVSDPWWIDFSLPTGTTKGSSLALVSIQDTTSTLMIPSEYVSGTDSSNNENMIGSLVDDLNVVMFAKDTVGITETKYSLSGVSTVKNYIVDIQPSQPYTVRLDGNIVGTYVASDQGILEFTTTNSGLVSIAPGDLPDCETETGGVCCIFPKTCNSGVSGGCASGNCCTPGQCVECLLTDASWSTSGPVQAGTPVQLTVQGTNCPNGKQVSFEVREDDSIGTDFDGADPIPQITIPNAIFNNNQIIVNWEAEWIEDVGGIDDDPEYVFRATIIDEPTKTYDSTNELKVIPECENDGQCPGQICCNQQCAPLVCDSDLGCDDEVSCTGDSCSNPGTCTASCSNTPNNNLCPINSPCESAICTLTGCQDTDCPVPESLYAWYPLDNDMNDYAGTNDGTCTNCPTPTTGQVGGSYDFDGNDNINIGNFNTGGNEITLAAWVDPDTISPVCGPRILSKAYGVQDYQHMWMLSYCDGGLRFRLRAGITPTTSTQIAGTATTGEGWIHVAATYDGTTMRLYKNGNLIGTQAHSVGGAITQSSDNAWIGANPDSSNYHDGRIDDVRIYSRALSQPEIQELYNNLPVCTDVDGDHFYLELSGCDNQLGFLGHGDCDDTNPNINPGAVEECWNTIDEDCDGYLDTGCEYICTFTNAYWQDGNNPEEAYPSSIVQLTVESTNCDDGTQVDLIVYEYDEDGTHEGLSSEKSPDDATFINNKATQYWHVWDAENFIDEDLTMTEYFFEARGYSIPMQIINSYNILQLLEPNDPINEIVEGTGRTKDKPTIQPSPMKSLWDFIKSLF